MLWDRAMSDTTTQRKTVPHRIEQIDQLQIGDEIVFERRTLDDEEIDSKRPLVVTDGSSKTVRSTHEDPMTGAEPYETRLSAVEVRGTWAGAKTYCLADAYNTLDGAKDGIVDHDSGIVVEVARVGRADGPAEETAADREVPA